jgi:potassium-transporting ATPase KdpC subunit
MWRQTRIAFILFAILTLITGMIYPLFITGLAQALFPHQANGSVVTNEGQKIASELIGQSFQNAGHFWGRPSVTAPVAYNGLSSAGSNLGPSNPALKTALQERVAALRAADPANALPIPIDLVTASASGLDPDISPAAAFYQVSRVARIRGLDEKSAASLVQANIRGRQFGILGEPAVNVQRLNTALDTLK